MKISIYSPFSIHEIGQRDNQEDSIAQWDNRLFVLCDGMGGHENGEVASQTVCQSLVGWFDEHVNPDEHFTDDMLREALEYAYTQLDQYDDGSLKMMGTTLTLLYIHSQGVTAAHIGDSRIYHVRPDVGVLYQSRDHSLVFDLLQAGEISYDEMATFPRKNIVTRAMTPGEDNRMRPDIIHIIDIQPNDYFYMCSDGMVEQMTNDALLTLLSANTSDKEKKQQLIACTDNNQDNHSAWLIHVEGVVHEKDDEEQINEEPTARCNAVNFIPKVTSANSKDDVVIVSPPPAQPKKWIKIGTLLLMAFFILAIIWLFFFRSKTGPEIQRPKPNTKTSISPRFNNDTINKDTNQLKKYESAGNQQ